MFTNLKNVIISFLSLYSKNKNLGTYTIFFFISFAFWFLTMLSKSHETNFTVPITYINYPADLVELSKPVDFLQVRVKAAGISIVSFYLFNHGSLVLDYDVVNSQPTANGLNLFWMMNSKREDLARIMGSSVDIIDVDPARLIVPFANKNKKEVPVILSSEINFRQAYWLADDVSISPSSVTIYGNQDLLDSVHFIHTDMLKLDDVNEDQVHEVGILIPDGLRCKNHSVSIDINVEPFIEEVLKAEVKVRNLNKGYSIKLFPSNVSVTLRLSKDQHRLVKTNFLRLYIDASNITGRKMIAVECDDLPKMVRVERIYPNSLEFLLIKE